MFWRRTHDIWPATAIALGVLFLWATIYIDLTIFAGILLAVFLTHLTALTSGRLGLARSWSLACVVAVIALLLGGTIYFFADTVVQQIDQLTARLATALGTVEQLKALQWARPLMGGAHLQEHLRSGFVGNLFGVATNMAVVIGGAGRGRIPGALSGGRAGGLHERPRVLVSGSFPPARAPDPGGGRQCTLVLDIGPPVLDVGGLRGNHRRAVGPEHALAIRSGRPGRSSDVRAVSRLDRRGGPGDRIRAIDGPDADGLYPWAVHGGAPHRRLCSRTARPTAGVPPSARAHPVEPAFVRHIRRGHRRDLRDATGRGASADHSHGLYRGCAGGACRSQPGGFRERGTATIPVSLKIARRETQDLVARFG